MRNVIHAAKSLEPTSAEPIASHLIQKEDWSDVVLMQLVTPQGVPYTFELSRQTAIEIADRLKTESAKGVTQTGNA